MAKDTKGGGDELANLFAAAKAGVAKEQRAIETEVEKREREAKEALEREEARKREEAQQRLIEEARRRNESLARRGRDEAPGRKVVSTAQHARPVAAAPEAVAEPIVTAQPAAPKAAQAPSKLLLVAGLVIGLGAGVGLAFALQPERKDAGLDLAEAARVVIATSKKQATSDAALTAKLDAEKARVSGLSTELDTAKKALATATEARAALEKELASVRAGAGNDGGTTAPTSGGSKKPHTKPGSGIPSIDSKVFGPR